MYVYWHMQPEFCQPAHPEGSVSVEIGKPRIIPQNLCHQSIIGSLAFTKGKQQYVIACHSSPTQIFPFNIRKNLGNSLLDGFSMQPGLIYRRVFLDTASRSLPRLVYDAHVALDFERSASLPNTNNMSTVHRKSLLGQYF